MAHVGWRAEIERKHREREAKEEVEREDAELASWWGSFNWRAIGVKVVLWYAVMRACYEYGHHFGAEYVFMCASVLYWISTNFEKREAGTLSAYSLFNEGFQALPGTLTAAQIDGQMRSGPQGPSPDPDHDVAPAAPRPFMGAGQAIGYREAAQEVGEDIDDEMLQRAIAASLQEGGGGARQRRTM